MAHTAAVSAAPPVLSKDELDILAKELAEAGISFKACRLWMQLIRRTKYGKVIANKAGQKAISFTVEESILVPTD